MTTTIDPVSGFSVIPNRETGESTFASDADTWVSEMDSVTTTMNTSIGQINTAGDEIESNAELAQTSADAASASANYKGEWSGKTNAGSVGESYGHNNDIWALNVNLADLSTSEPSDSNSDWQKLGFSSAGGDITGIGSITDVSLKGRQSGGNSRFRLLESIRDLGNNNNGIFFATNGSSATATLGFVNNGSNVDGLTIDYANRIYTFIRPVNVPTPTAPTNAAPKAYVDARDLPAGAMVIWPSSIIPTGFLQMRGQSFSPTTYPELALIYTGLTLPDMRAEFIRGWDGARGVDPNRGILTSQAEEFPAHTHTVNGGDGNIEVQGGSTGGATNDVDSTTGSTGGTENRPRNIAWNILVVAR